MCLSVPAKILSCNGKKAIVNLGEQQREVYLAFEGGEPGDWVLLYSGIALCLLEHEEAKQTIELLEKLK